MYSISEEDHWEVINMQHELKISQELISSYKRKAGLIREDIEFYDSIKARHSGFFGQFHPDYKLANKHLKKSVVELQNLIESENKLLELLINKLNKLKENNND